MPIHFLSGMPRSGSTLMSAVLAQNPALHVVYHSPVAQVITRLVNEMSTKENEGGIFYTRESRIRTLRGIFAAFYTDYHDKVIIDVSRRWCAHMALLNTLFPGSKTVACVRDVREILDSFERLFQKNPEQVSRIINRPNTTVYDRVPILLENDSVVGYSLNSMRQAYFGLFQENLLVVDYPDFAKSPKLVLRDLHAALQLEPFDYDFDNVKNHAGAEEVDRHLSTPGLHIVRPKVTYEPRFTCLPPDIWNHLPPPFWKQNAQKNHPVKKND